MEGGVGMRARLSRLTAAATGRRTSAVHSSTHGLPGWFIAVEGGDGAGKSTQIDSLARWLRKRGFDVVTTREPGATVLGAKLREILLHTKDREPVGARAEALLFAADRADHVEKVVRPALERGAIVLTDRHVDSSVAYQSGGRGLPAEEIVELSAFATEGLRPDLVVLLDIDPAVAWERAQTRVEGPDRLEAEPAQFHRKVREVFRTRAAAEPSRYLVVDAAEPPGVITAIIEDRLEQLLPRSAREAKEAAEQERTRRAAEEAEQQEQQARRAAERAEAERLAEQRKAEQEAARKAEEQRREQARQAQARRAAEERDRYEEQKAEQRRRAEADRRAAELHDAQLREQAEADAEHRRQIELAVRQAEARAKGQARDQATRDLNSRAESEARTARMVQAAMQQRDAAAASDPAQESNGDAEKRPAVTKPALTTPTVTTSTAKTAELRLDLGPTAILSTPSNGHHDFDEDEDDDYDDDNDLPRSRWRLGLGRRKS